MAISSLFLAGFSCAAGLVANIHGRANPVIKIQACLKKRGNKSAQDILTLVDSADAGKLLLRVKQFMFTLRASFA